MAIIVAAVDLLRGLKFVRSVLWLAVWEHAAHVIDGSERDYTDATVVPQG